MSSASAIRSSSEEEDPLDTEDAPEAELRLRNRVIAALLGSAGSASFNVSVDDSGEDTHVGGIEIVVEVVNDVEGGGR